MVFGIKTVWNMIRTSGDMSLLQTKEVITTQIQTGPNKHCKIEEISERNYKIIERTNNVTTTASEQTAV